MSDDNSTDFIELLRQDAERYRGLRRLATHKQYYDIKAARKNLFPSHDDAGFDTMVDKIIEKYRK